MWRNSVLGVIASPDEVGAKQSLILRLLRSLRSLAMTEIGLFQCSVIVLLIAGMAFGEEQFKYDSGDSRDPFIPLIANAKGYASGVSGIGDLILEGIVWDGSEGSVAIVNGTIVTEGEEIGAVKILKIEESAVTFDVDGDVVRVELVEE